LLYSFTGQSDGAAPASRVVFAPDGDLFGTTAAGQTDNCNGVGGCGTIFRLHSTLGGASWVFNTLYTFRGASGDGSDPYGELAFDGSTLYGTTRYGGSGGGIASSGQANCVANNSSATPYGCGTVFEMHTVPPPGQSDDPTILWNFDSSTANCNATLDGIEPIGGVVMDSNSNLLGTTVIGGDSSTYFGYGTVFQLTPSGVEDVLENLDDGSHGGYTFGSLYSQSSSGPFYGSAADAGGTGNDGVAFDLTSASLTCGSWMWNYLTSFPILGYPNNPTGAKLDLLGPRATLVMYNGNLYGTQTTGGDYNYGAIFEIPCSGGSCSTPNTLYSFMGGSDGAYPQGGLVVDGNGNLYGTTYSGGQANCVFDSSGKKNILGCGVVFEYMP